MGKGFNDQICRPTATVAENLDFNKQEGEEELRPLPEPGNLVELDGSVGIGRPRKTSSVEGYLLQTD